MAYSQNPGRGDSPKTGSGLPSPLMQGRLEDAKKLQDQASKVVSSRKSNSKLNNKDLQI